MAIIINDNLGCVFVLWLSTNLRRPVFDLQQIVRRKEILLPTSCDHSAFFKVSEICWQCTHESRHFFAIFRVRSKSQITLRESVYFFERLRFWWKAWWAESQCLVQDTISGHKISPRYDFSYSSDSFITPLTRLKNVPFGYFPDLGLVIDNWSLSRQLRFILRSVASHFHWSIIHEKRLQKPICARIANDHVFSWRKRELYDTSLLIVNIFFQGTKTQFAQ